MALHFVTGNEKKLAEVKQLLGCEFKSASIDLPELQGEPEDIAREKCKLAFKELGQPVLTEDTSLCFTALKGLPGPYVKWFLAKTGHEGLNNLLAAYEDKSAYAQTIFAYCDGDVKEPEIFVGQTEGKIVPARGSGNFGNKGWDPVFLPNGFDQTYAEMTAEAKGAISHRSKALNKVRDYMKNKVETTTTA